jgi:hypothetical protein
MLLKESRDDAVEEVEDYNMLSEEESYADAVEEVDYEMLSEEESEDNAVEEVDCRMLLN